MTWQPVEKLAELFDPLGHAVSAWLGFDLPGHVLFVAVLGIYFLLHFAAAKLHHRPGVPPAASSVEKKKGAASLGSAEPEMV